MKYHAEDEEDLTNPQFVATTVVEEKIPGAAAISLIDFSPEEDEPSDPWELNLDASMKVCEYLGMTDLPNGEDPDIPPQYLLIRDKGVNTAVGAFPEVSFDNLHFEGENGLKSYYAKTIESYNYGKRITAQVKLSPADVENLMLRTIWGEISARCIASVSAGRMSIAVWKRSTTTTRPAPNRRNACF